jgi:hypothetical protein
MCTNTSCEQTTWLSPLRWDSYYFPTLILQHLYSAHHFILILSWNVITWGEEAYKNIPFWMDPQFFLLYGSLPKELVYKYYTFIMNNECLKCLSFNTTQLQTINIKQKKLIHFFQLSSCDPLKIGTSRATLRD